MPIVIFYAERCPECLEVQILGLHDLRFLESTSLSGTCFSFCVRVFMQRKIIKFAKTVENALQQNSTNLALLLLIIYHDLYGSSVLVLYTALSVFEDENDDDDTVTVVSFWLLPGCLKKFEV